MSVVSEVVIVVVLIVVVVILVVVLIVVLEIVVIVLVVILEIVVIVVLINSSAHQFHLPTNSIIITIYFDYSWRRYEYKLTRRFFI